MLKPPVINPAWPQEAIDEINRLWDQENSASKKLWHIEQMDLLAKDPPKGFIAYKSVYINGYDDCLCKIKKIINSETQEGEG